MKGDREIIMYLNGLLSDELIAANQYFLHSKIFENLGLKRLHNLEYQEYIEELSHADSYTKRILFLEGSISLRSFSSVCIKKDVEGMLRMDLDIEYSVISSLKDGIKYANSIQDYVSKDIMVEILKNEEKHIDFLETELDIMVKIGIPNYIQSQLS